MASPTVNVVRYTALFSGIAYGWWHHNTLQAAADKHKREHAVHTRERLIKEAKQAWTQKQQAAKGNGVITDPEDPRFDLEKLIAKWETSP